MQIISKKEAISRGMNKYFNGKPCKYGHISERWVHGGCVECRDIFNQSSHSKEYQRKYREANKEKIALTKKKCYLRDKERILKKNREYHIKYNTENRAKRNYNLAKNRAKAINRLPDWLNERDFNKMLEIYEEAYNKSVTSHENYEVDHIIPMRGARVSGLHVPTNLQVITKSNNKRKSNKFDISLGDGIKL